MKAYKVFNPDWTCRNFLYEVGKSYEINEMPVLCAKGFHACKKAIDCFGYYSFNPKNKVAEVELFGDIVGKDGGKQATNKILIVKELTWHEVLELVNDTYSFTEASEIMEGMLTLRPEVVQELLEKCTSIKVKRLFMFFSKEHNLPVFKDINLKKINLGSGKRVIIKKGHLDAVYDITVPKKNKRENDF